MDKPFTLLQISDCHLSEDPQALYRNQNPDQGLAGLVGALKRFQPDGVVLTGDLAEDGSKAAYERVIEHLGVFSCPKAFIPGNHDDPALMQDALGGAGFLSGPVLDWGGWTLALLDSTVENDPAGFLDEEQFGALEQAQSQQNPTMVFVHHPPMVVGAEWIDRYPLRQAQRFLDALDPKWVKVVGFGHVHQVFSAQLNGIQFLSAPATSTNSQAQMAHFTPDPTGPKARWFRLWPNGRWATGIVSQG